MVCEAPLDFMAFKCSALLVAPNQELIPPRIISSYHFSGQLVTEAPIKNARKSSSQLLVSAKWLILLRGLTLWRKATWQNPNPARNTPAVWCW